MTPEETKKAAAVMIAFAEGKTILSRPVLRSDRERRALSPIWNWEEHDYRVAPEPIEVEVWVHPDGRIFGREGDCGAMSIGGFKLRHATIHPETK